MTGGMIFAPESFQTFGELLHYLRERAEFSQRELALQVGYHYSYMSRIEKNERLPDAATLKARFVPALGLEDQPQWVERLLVLATPKEEESACEQAKPPPASAPLVEPARPALASATVSLPVHLTPLVGREREREAIVKLLLRPEVRLVTLVGPPGVGKTRLAIHVASRVIEKFAHGMAFADLSAVMDPKDVLPVLADSVGVQDVSDEPLMDRLVGFLNRKEFLLVADNFEQLLEAAPQLAQILSRAPQVKALVTSREALRVSGEHEYTVPALPLPEQGAPQLSDNPSILLFLQRAQAVISDFELTPENTPAVVDICRRLDGLPLAIELAAARVKLFSPQAMLAQFDRRFEWLARSGRDGPAWRRTLSGAVEWSYNLLTDQEKALLRRLSVFPSSWDLPAAEAVCPGGSEVSCGNVFQHLIQLTEKSLVVVEEGRKEPRWRLLETMRQFGYDRLMECGEVDAVRARHLAYFANWLEAVANTLDDGHVLDYYQYIEPELNNLRAALNWALDEKADRAQGLRTAAAFCLLGMEYSLLKESEEWFQKILPLADQPEHRRFRSILLHRGASIIYLGRWHKGIHEAYKLAKEGEQIARELNDTRLIASAIYNQWEILADLGKYEEARVLLEEGIELCRACGYQTQLNTLMSALANVLTRQGKLAEAVENAKHGYEIALRLGDLWGQGLALRTLATTLRAQKKFAESLETFMRALEVAQRMGDRIGSGIILANMSAVANALGDYAASGRYAQQAFTIFQAIGSEYQRAFPLRMMAYAAIRAGDLDCAHKLNLDSLRLNYPMGDEHRVGVYGNLVALAEMAAVEKQFERAAQLASLVEKHITEEKRVFQEPDALAFERVKSALGKGKIGSQAANQVTLEQAIRDMGI
ncbi:MAG: tetratricopeptide repeat protein [Chloroflexi bacterium]|nr:tetratricopeptide repeat protein [Chloroflexota bacterium]